MLNIVVKKILPIVVTYCYVVCSGTELTRISADIVYDEKYESDVSTEDLFQMDI